MVVNHDAMIRKLKKQVKLLRRREEMVKKEVKTALKTVSKLGKTYKNKLARTVRVLKSKISHEKSQVAELAKCLLEKKRKVGKKIKALRKR